MKKQIDWDKLDPKYFAVVNSKKGLALGYFFSKQGDTYRTSCDYLTQYDTDGTDWENSLQFRPQESEDYPRDWHELNDKINSLEKENESLNGQLETLKACGDELESRCKRLNEKNIILAIENEVSKAKLIGERAAFKELTELNEGYLSPIQNKLADFMALRFEWYLKNSLGESSEMSAEFAAKDTEIYRQAIERMRKNEW